ncbi:TraG family conjugative transposon ATPase [Chitinophaga lutea]|uniref:TraG family conjugative transposon ATPase n=1 Tax=Chitinophaga lutea TaxID=2488634 RepID=A0A3N4PYZ4_9BACT|nr:TraG family conjugative transposon ATPase [Chitinophaga lutea]RPE13178.1 TraG family conjugative transposon ATPase [Chitinophaga lutea]
MNHRHPLDDIMPIYKVEQDCIVSKQGDVTVAFRLHLPEIFTLSTDDYLQLHAAWVKAIRVLPNQTVLHKQDWFTQAHYQGQFESQDTSFLSHCNERHFHERPWLDHQGYLYLTKTATTTRSRMGLLDPRKSVSVLPHLPLSHTATEQFFDKVGQFIKILSDSGLITTQRLTTDELVSTTDRAGLLERYCYLLDTDQPVVQDIRLKKDLHIGQRRCQLFTLADTEDLPALCGPRINHDKYSSEKTKFSVGFAAPLGLLLDCNHIYNQYVVIADPAATLQELEKKRLRLQSLSAYSRENFLAKEATNEFLNEAIGDQRMALKAHFSILTWHESEADAKAVKNQVAAALSQLDARCKQETISTATLFWAGVPGAAAGLPTHETFDTFAEQAACFFANETNYRTSLSPTGIRFGDRLSGVPVKLDLISEPMKRGWCQNRNFFIVGPSGSGKSFLMAHLLRSLHATGSHLIIIDVGHSYKGLCDMLGGYYYTYTEANPIRFNPFIIEGELDTEKKESIKTLLLALWKRDNQGFTRAEYIALSNALQSYYKYLDAHPDIFPCFNSFYDFLNDQFIPELRAQGITANIFDVENFMYVLRSFYKGGEFDYLLNATENLDVLDQSFLVYELDAIKDHPILYIVAILTVMQVFITKMRRLKGVHKALIIEEAWKAIMREGMAEYVLYLVKTVRKYFGSLGVVTQEIDDTVKSPIIKDAIINNSDIKILLDQSKYQNKFSQIQDLLGLTDKDKTLILSMNKGIAPGDRYKHVTFMLGQHVTKVYRTEVSLEEYLTYTTEEKEKIQVQAYAEKYGSMAKGVAMLAAHIRAGGSL